MHALFTEETCTGTGATLALAGVTTGAIAFSESFADGDPVAYILEDSGGTIKIAGIGNYVSATDDITRNDTWNWNGTVIDDNPSTNITLSGGTHTVRCDLLAEKAFSGVNDIASLSGTDYQIPDNFISAEYSLLVPAANRALFLSVFFLSSVVITNFETSVTTLDGSATNTRRGIYTAKKNGQIGDLLDGSGNIDVSTTGIKTTALATPLRLPAGRYFMAFVTDGTALRVRGPNTTNHMIGIASGVKDSVGRFQVAYQSSVTGALPSTVTHPTVSTANSFCPVSYS
jgi:hypothetical protein